jgi:DNA-directed RNA polymerase specialized sigma24 family protein
VGLRELLLNVLTARARSVQALLRVAAELRLAAPAAVDPVDQRLDSGSQVGLGDGHRGRLPPEQSEDMLTLGRLLAKLEQADPRAARVVELRLFDGLDDKEVAKVLGVSVMTVTRDWKVARAWLIGRLQARKTRAPALGSTPIDSGFHSR